MAVLQHNQSESGHSTGATQGPLMTHFRHGDLDRQQGTRTVESLPFGLPWGLVLLDRDTEIRGYFGGRRRHVLYAALKL
jgi:hypothetical protein